MECNRLEDRHNATGSDYAFHFLQEQKRTQRLDDRSQNWWNHHIEARLILPSMNQSLHQVLHFLRLNELSLQSYFLGEPTSKMKMKHITLAVFKLT